MRVINKVRLCTTAPLSVFVVESLGSTPFYNRRGDFERLLAKYVNNPKFKKFFAMPYFDQSIHGLEWHVDKDLEGAVRLSSLAGTAQYQEVKRCIAEAVAYFNGLKRKASEQEKVYFNCLLKYVDSDEIDDMVFVTPSQVIMGVWGIKALPGRDMVSAIVTDVDDTRLHRVSFVATNATLKGTASFKRRHGYRLRPGVDVPVVMPAKGFKFAGWSPFDPSNALVNEDLEFTTICEQEATAPSLFGVRFDAAGQGSLVGAPAFAQVAAGEVLLPSQVPQVRPADGYRFTGWDMPIDAPINSDMTFRAVYEIEPVAEAEQQPIMHNVHFDAGEFGQFITAQPDTQVASGTVLSAAQVPVVKAADGYKFTGWDAPLGNPINSDQTFRATYGRLAADVPWWKDLFSEGCLMWLLRFLLALLLVLLVAIVLTRCTTCNRHVLYYSEAGVIGHITTRDGRVIDDNGNCKPVDDISVDANGQIVDGWDDGEDVAPTLVDANGNNSSPIEQQDSNDPNKPPVLADRLNIFFEDDNADFDKWARDFHRVYQGDNYEIIGKDKNSNWLQIKVPEQERGKIRDELTAKISSPRFRVVDEVVMNGGPNDGASLRQNASTLPAGWHIEAARIKQAWDVTKGDDDVTIAIIDDGIDLNHELFRERITKPYNIFRCDGRLSAGQGHGTHVAGIAAGGTSHLSQGVAGVAPQCKIMPVQVFDNGMCTASSLIRGIMYAIRNDADVVNVSIGTAYPLQLGYSVPVEVQRLVAQTQFKDAEKVWNWVFSHASAKNTIIVFAVGNSHLLAGLQPQLRSQSTINVGAVGNNFSITPWSNYGSAVSVTAPGEAICSSLPGGQYKQLDGTSMAAPIVTGVVALMKSINKRVTVAQATQALTSTGHATEGGNSSGPAIQADAALRKIKQM